MKSLVGAFNQEKALVGAFSVIVQPVVEPMDRLTALDLRQGHGLAAPRHRGVLQPHQHRALAPRLQAQQLHTRRQRGQGGHAGMEYYNSQMIYSNQSNKLQSGAEPHLLLSRLQCVASIMTGLSSILSASRLLSSSHAASVSSHTSARCRPRTTRPSP